jgi:DNA-binding MarR family transcriptional regulator
MGRVTGAPGSPPLARLFAIAYRALIDDLHEELRRRRWVDVRPAFGFVLLAAADAPTTATSLASLMGTSKQAASKLVDAMVTAGYVRRKAGEADSRQRPIYLTDRGRRLLAAVEEIYAVLEARWAAVIGAGNVERLRRDLTRVLSGDGALPPVRPTW